LVPQVCKLIFRQLKHKIIGETFYIASYELDITIQCRLLKDIH